MLKRCITSQAGRKPIEAAAPKQGAAAIFCSTGIPLIYENLWYSLISQQTGQTGKTITFYNLLARKHYFRLNRAETPLPNVVLIEGQKNKPAPIREVAA